MTTVVVVLSSPGSLDECRLSAGWPPTLRPSQTTCKAVSPPVGCYHPHPPSPLLLLLSRKLILVLPSHTEGGMLSRLRHCSKDAQPVPSASEVTTSWCVQVRLLLLLFFHLFFLFYYYYYSAAAVTINTTVRGET